MKACFFKLDGPVINGGKVLGVPVSHSVQVALNLKRLGLSVSKSVTVAAFSSHKSGHNCLPTTSQVSWQPILPPSLPASACQPTTGPTPLSLPGPPSDLRMLQALDQHQPALKRTAQQAQQPQQPEMATNMSVFVAQACCGVHRLPSCIRHMLCSLSAELAQQ